MRKACCEAGAAGSRHRIYDDWTEKIVLASQTNTMCLYTCTGNEMSLNEPAPAGSVRGELRKLQLRRKVRHSSTERQRQVCRASPEQPGCRSGTVVAARVTKVQYYMYPCGDYGMYMLLVLIPALLAGPVAGSAAPPRPNVLILFVDDWGWGDLGANCFAMADVPGARADRLDKETACSTANNRTLTPQLDKLAASGMRFTDHHATGVCTPSRSQLQTGRMGARTGISSNFGPGSLGGLPQTEKTVATLIKQAGYRTCAIGKWHMKVRKQRLSIEE